MSAIHFCMSGQTLPDWSLIQSFLAVAETGSLSAAARRLQATQPTIGRHIQTLETSLNVSLFVRQARGMALTDHGHALLSHAKDMHEAAGAFGLMAAGKTETLEGTVRITASVFTAHQEMPPIISELRERYPEIAIELVATDASENLLFREADIAVRMYRPRQLDMVTKFVGYAQLGLFASKSFVQRYGRPQNAEDLMNFDFVGFDRDEGIIRGFREAGYPVDRHFFKTRCDDQNAYWALVRAGCGLGFAHATIGMADPTMERIDINLEGMDLPRLEVWLTAHERGRKTPRVDALWPILAQRLEEACD